MFCKNCGNEVAENTRFCNACGTPIEQVAEQPAEQYGEQPVEQYVEQPVAEDCGAAAVQEPTAVGGKKLGGKTIAVLAGCVVVAILLIIGVAKLFSGMGGGDAVYTYVNDDYELMYLENLKAKTEPVEITDEANENASVRLSKDGKYMYFLGTDNPEYYDSEMTLYYIQVSKLGKKDAKPEKISSGVVDYIVLDKGMVLYAKADSGYQLRLFDGKDSSKLVSDVEDYSVNADQTYVYYTERDNEDNTISLYRIPLKKDGEKERLLKGASAIYSDYDAETLVYGEYNDPYSDGLYNPEDDNYTVYSCAPGGEKTKLVKDALSVYGLTVDGKKVSFYYTTRQNEETTMYDFFTDKSKADDEELLNSSISYPNWSDYSVWDVYEDGQGGYYYESYNGIRYDLDSSYVVADYWDARDAARDQADRLYDQAYEEYYALSDQIDAAQWRNNLRDYLQNNVMEVEYFNLHKFEGGNATEIAANINPGYFRVLPFNGIFLYQKLESDETILGDVSELEYYDHAYDLVYSGETQSVWYQNVGGVESLLNMDLDEDETLSISSTFVLNDKEVVLNAQVDGEWSLRSFKIGKNELTYSDVITDEDYTGVRKGVDAKDNEVLYYYLDVEINNDGFEYGDLICYSDGKETQVAKEIAGYYLLDDSNTEYVLGEYEYEKGRLIAELSILKNGKTVSVSDEVEAGSITFLDGKQLMYMSDGDLYLWDGSEDRKIAEDVLAYFVWGAESYCGYFA